MSLSYYHTQFEFSYSKIGLFIQLDLFKSIHWLVKYFVNSKKKKTPQGHTQTKEETSSLCLHLLQQAVSHEQFRLKSLVCMLG